MIPVFLRLSMLLILCVATILQCQIHNISCYLQQKQYQN
uniref:Uncharacterized protein n=1 Tax=Anguilla anguilla TaxID=7936 RepID=A0A0E9TKS0_ANGAN